MAKVLIVYYSRSGNTKKMAEIVAQGVKEEDVSVKVKGVEETKVEEMLDYDGIIIGSPTYYGTLAWQVKKFFDESVKFHGRLNGKVGGAFTSSANIGGGNETTILSIIQALLIHGMVVQGNPSGDHYGAVAIDAPDVRARENCLELGRRVGHLVKKISHGS